MAFVASMAQSPGRGAIYVHPYMQWNSPSGVMMIAIAQGIETPDRQRLSGHHPAVVRLRDRCPAPLPGSRGAVAAAEMEGRNRGQRLWWRATRAADVTVPPGVLAIEKIPPATDLSHPSEPRPETAGSDRTNRRALDATRPGGHQRFAVKTPAGFSVAQVEVHFQATPVARVPASIDVYGIDAAPRIRLNEGQSGQWLESLAADALVRRELPVATIRLAHPTTGASRARVPRRRRSADRADRA